MQTRRTSLRQGLRLFLLCLIAVATAGTAAGAEPDQRSFGHWIVGTWYLALDTEVFGLPPGFPLSGLAQFNRDGTYRILDANDFGQATFLNSQHSQQFGAWRGTRAGRMIGTALFLQADLATGEVLRWERTHLQLSRTDERDVVTGVVNVSVLECNNLLPLPSPLTCPDPIEAADDFVAMPPTDIPVTLRRLRP